MASFIWIISCLFTLTCGLKNPHPVASVHLKEMPTCTSEALPKAVHEWKQGRALPKVVEWTYGAHVSSNTKLYVEYL